MISRPEMLLSVQRALLGAVSPWLRGVAVDLRSDTATVFFYHDGEIHQDGRDDLTTVTAEIAADMTQEVEVRDEIVRLDPPARLPDHSLWAYHRKE